MGVNAHVASCTRQALVLAEWYVLLRRQVDVFFSKTEVNDMDNMLLPVWVSSNQEVLRLDVAVD